MHVRFFAMNNYSACIETTTRSCDLQNISLIQKKQAASRASQLRLPPTCLRLPEMLHDELHLSGGEYPGAASESAAEQSFAEGLTAVDPVLYRFPGVVFVALRGVEESQFGFAVTAYLKTSHGLVVSHALFVPLLLCLCLLLCLPKSFCVFCLYHLLCVVILLFKYTHYQ